jgi:hypothetical protein
MTGAAIKVFSAVMGFKHLVLWISHIMAIFTPIIRTTSHATLLDGIPRVVFGGAKKKMIRSATWRVVAGMANKFFGIVDWPVGQYPGKSAGSYSLTLPGKDSVSRTSMTGIPKPTIARFIYLSPKIFWSVGPLSKFSFYSTHGECI